MNDSIIERAAEWHAAQDGDAMDWDAFTLWLEADPRHRVAFDQIALLDDDLVMQRGSIGRTLGDASIVDRPQRHWRFLATGTLGAVAAALALIVGLPYVANGPDQSVSYETARGETRQILLRDGSRITLAPLSVLKVADARQSQLALAGTAYFDIKHRSDRALTIAAGGLVVRDIGTAFAIDSGADGARVAVAEGSINIASTALPSPVALTAGQSFTTSKAAGTAVRGAQRADAIASWRHGQLVYDKTPLALVVSDLGRYASTTVTIDPTLASRRFSGILTIGDGTGLVDDVAAIMALDARPVGNGIRLEPARKP